MKKQNLEKGRVRQKQHTREQILNAAQQLLKKKKNWGLEDVAIEAGISRATVYRYFSNKDLLITETALDIHHKSPEELYDEVKDTEIAKTLLSIQRYYNGLAREHETGFRRYLSVALKASTTSRQKVRGARRPKSFKYALQKSGINLTDDKLDKLVCASSLLSGIDAHIMCKDVNQMTNEETSAFLEWCLGLVLKEILK